MSKVSDNHPWKRRKKVKAECLACKKVFERDPDGAKNTCSVECEKMRQKIRHITHVIKGGFR